jgi:hypothetical protein
MKTAYAVLARIGVREATKRNMPPELLGSRRHTHNALDDAIEQGELFANVFEWVARRRDGRSRASRSSVPPPPAWLAEHVGR